MNTWETIWYWVICSALVTYFGLGFAITIGGFFDVKKMFRRLDAAHDAAQAERTETPRNCE